MMTNARYLVEYIYKDGTFQTEDRIYDTADEAIKSVRERVYFDRLHNDSSIFIWKIYQQVQSINGEVEEREYLSAYAERTAHIKKQDVLIQEVK